MRVIAGEWRRRPLLAPKRANTRPSADRTRETLFNMLASRLGSFEGLWVADLFAGSGALGIEALSRGAAHCLFVEQDRAAIEAIRANLRKLGALERATIEPRSVMALGPCERAPDLILLDPPYDTGAGMVALDRMLRLGWIEEHTWIALECGVREKVEVKGLEMVAQRRVGKAQIALMRKAN